LGIKARTSVSYGNAHCMFNPTVIIAVKTFETWKLTLHTFQDEPSAHMVKLTFH